MSLYEYAEQVRTLSVCANSMKKNNNNGNDNIRGIQNYYYTILCQANEQSTKSTFTDYPGAFIFVTINRIRMRTLFDIHFRTHTAYVVHLKDTLYLTESNKSYILSHSCTNPWHLYNVLDTSYVDYCGLLT